MRQKYPRCRNKSFRNASQRLSSEEDLLVALPYTAALIFPVLDFLPKKNVGKLKPLTIPNLFPGFFLYKVGVLANWCHFIFELSFFLSRLLKAVISLIYANINLSLPIFRKIHRELFGS